MKKTLKLLLMFFICIIGLLIFSNKAEASVSGIQIFDYKLYADTYSDLKAAYGYNEQALYNHYIAYGLNEGRIGSLVFDQKYYVSRYSDLANAYGTNYVGAFNHFINYGINEGRQGAITFDSTYYLSNYSDLKAAYGSKGYQNATIHYLKYGVSEGRRGSLQFDIEYYLKNNSDLSKAFGSKGYRKGIIHFIQYGLSEGRETSSNFILNYYKANYSDLKSAFGSNNLSYFIHYMNYGKSEGRIANYLITSNNTTVKINIYYKEYYSDEEIATSTTIEGKTGEEYDIENYIIDIDGYEYSEASSDLTGTFEEDLKITLYYLNEISFSWEIYKNGNTGSGDELMGSGSIAGRENVESGYLLFHVSSSEYYSKYLNFAGFTINITYINETYNKTFYEETIEYSGVEDDTLGNYVAMYLAYDYYSGLYYDVEENKYDVECVGFADFWDFDQYSYTGAIKAIVTIDLNWE